MKKYVGIVSGGIDSTLFAFTKAIHNLADLTMLTFQYGQKASKECQQLLEITKVMSVVYYPGIKFDLKILDITFMKELWAGTQLTDSFCKIEEGYTPSVVVPLRNAVFTTIGMAYAYTIKADALLLGSHTGDVAPVGPGRQPAYPDCTPEFYESLETALHIGHFRECRNLKIITPSLLGISKDDIIYQGFKVMKDLIFDTWSCYHSGEFHCGVCESCRNRRKAFQEAGIKDKTRYKVI